MPNYTRDLTVIINSFNYIEEYNTVTVEYTKQILNELFDEKNLVMSVIKSK